MIIHFSKDENVVPTEELELSDDDVPEDATSRGGIKSQLRGAAAVLFEQKRKLVGDKNSLGMAKNGLEEFRIKCKPKNPDEPDAQADVDPGRFLVYRYKFDEQPAENTEGSPYDEEDRENTIAVARWFAKHPEAFGEYDTADWNCEVFASFCKTTVLTVKDLEGMARDPTTGALDKNMLLHKSSAYTFQLGEDRKKHPRLHS